MGGSGCWRSHLLPPLPGHLRMLYPTGGSLRFTPGYLSAAPPGQRHHFYPAAFYFRGNGVLAGPEGRQIDSPGRQPGVLQLPPQEPWQGRKKRIWIPSGTRSSPHPSFLESPRCVHIHLSDDLSGRPSRRRRAVRDYFALPECAERIVIDSHFRLHPSGERVRLFAVIDFCTE